MTNITDIGTAIENLNTTIEINTTTIITDAINQGNIQSDGWSGILIFAMIFILIIVYLIKNKQEFKLNTEIALASFGTLIIFDLGLILYQYRLIYNIQPIVFVLTLFITIVIFSLLKKEREAFSN